MMVKALILASITSAVCATESCKVYSTDGMLYTFNVYAFNPIGESANGQPITTTEDDARTQRQHDEQHSGVQPMSPAALADATTSPNAPPTTTHSTRPPSGESLLDRFKETQSEDGSAALPSYSATYTAPPSYATSGYPIPTSHPLFLTLTQGVKPGERLIYRIKDLSNFRLTAEMGNFPRILENYEMHILPQLRRFVKKRHQNTDTQNKQIQIYNALADFHILIGKKAQAIYMIIGIANIYGLQKKNLEAFQTLNRLIEHIKNNTPAKDRCTERTLGSVFVMMAKSLYYMEEAERKEHKPTLDNHHSLCKPYIIAGMLKHEQNNWLSALGYSAAENATATVKYAEL